MYDWYRLLIITHEIIDFIDHHLASRSLIVLVHVAHPNTANTPSQETVFHKDVPSLHSCPTPLWPR